MSRSFRQKFLNTRWPSTRPCHSKMCQMIIVLGLSYLENQIYTKMFVFDTVGVWNCNSVRVTKRPPKADYTKDHKEHKEEKRKSVLLNWRRSNSGAKSSQGLRKRSEYTWNVTSIYVSGGSQGPPEADSLLCALCDFFVKPLWGALWPNRNVMHVRFHIN